jgi:hypothetical protein
VAENKHVAVAVAGRFYFHVALQDARSVELVSILQVALNFVLSAAFGYRTNIPNLPYFSASATLST